MNEKIELTEERKRRVAQAMVETIEKLEKEQNYSEDLQNKEIIKFYISHIENLGKMLQ